MNRRLIWVLLLGAWSPLVGQLAHAEEKPPCDPWAAKIAAVQGKVEAKRTGDKTWHTTTRNIIYCPGDQIRVGKDARASIILINDTLIRLDQYSVITLNKIEAEETSLLELIKGIAHFISRVPRSLKVNTPFVNAAIEGTEFVVAVGEADTTVTVFEGSVLTQNENGQVRLIQNESSITKQGQAPEKILLAKPRDTVQWALYFPPIIKADESGSVLQQASSLLYKGRVTEASALLTNFENNGEAKALQAIIAIVNNDKDTAFKLANDAVQLTPDSAAPHIAMSYAWQAKLDLNAALASAQQAINKEVDNAIARARLAELQLSVGKLNDALDSAKKATELDGSVARAQTTLGYAYLTQIKINQARATFEKAIELDQSDPLPHLGLGLAMIRKNELAEGRREIEIAASLDPNNAIIRSYLGKAYYEEKRAPLDAEQFAMAKALDPNDPTPYYYDAIRKQSENDPVGALEDLNKSIALNDNRAVYRSSLQLDQDEAARQASIARIYRDLKYDQVGINEAYISLNTNQNDFSGHRFLAEAYANIPRHEIALASELWQARLTQPAILNPPRPELLSTATNIVNDTRILSSVNDNGLIYKDGTSFLLDLAGGSNETFYDNLILSGIYGTNSFSLSQFHYETNGYRVNNDFEQDILDASFQTNLTTTDKLLLSYTEDETSEGDTAQSIIPDNFSDSLRADNKDKTTRLGYVHTFSSESNIILSGIHQDNEVKRTRTDTLNLAPGTDLVDDTTRNIDSDIYSIEAQGNGRLTGKVKYVVGIGTYSQETKDDTNISSTLLINGFPPIPQAPIDINLDYKIRHHNAYLYTNYLINPSNTIVVGVSADDYEDTDATAQYDKSTINPKFGYILNLNNRTRFRLAAFQTLKRAFIANQTIEPTQVAGFNQFFDDINGSVSKRYGLAFDHSVSDSLYMGIELSVRDVDSPSEVVIINGNTLANLTDRDEELIKTYFYWTISSNFVLGLSPWLEKQNRTFMQGFADNTRASKIETISVPITFTLLHPTGWTTTLSTTYYDQDVEFPALTGVSAYQSDAWIVDAEIAYRLPRRLGKISLIARNITDENELFHDQGVDGQERVHTVVPETTYLITFNFHI